MEYIIFTVGLLIGFAAGVLFGRRNRIKVEDVIAQLKENYRENVRK